MSVVEGGRKLLHNPRIERTRMSFDSFTMGTASRYPIALTVIGITVATVAMLFVRGSLGVLNVALIYLLIVFLVALLTGPKPASIAAIVSFALFDFLFIPPYHTLSIANTDHVLALFVYLGVAVVTGQLVAGAKARTEEAVRESQRTALLYELNAALVGDVTLDAILNRIAERVVAVYGAAACQLLLPDEEGRLAIRASFPADRANAIDRQQLAMANWVMEHRSPAGQSTSGRRVRIPHGVEERSSHLLKRNEDVLFLPIATKDRVVGVLGVSGKPGGGRFGADDEQLLTSFANQAALALERARLSAEAARVEVLAQSDELKSALLSAVSHELRTPLAAIKASSSSLLDTSVEWDNDARREFLEAIDQETDRLTLMVGNLLDLTRIEGGALRPNREWYDVAELVSDVERRLASQLNGHPFSTSIQPNMPQLWFDYIEIAHVLMNLCENAIKHTPPGTAIKLIVRKMDNAVEFTVQDRGKGIPPAVQKRLFEKFYRADQRANVPGIGIGLTITKGLVEAHGGRIWVESAEGSGTSFFFTIPLAPGVPSGE